MDTKLCTAGFARLDITPPLGTYICGYFRPRYTKGVLDPLYVRAIAFGEGEKSAVVLVVDNCGLRAPACHSYPVEVAKRLGLPRESVFLCCTHSHTTPAVTSEESDKEYDAWLLRRLGDAAQLALDDRKPVTDIRAGQRQTEGLTYSRRYRMKDGAQMGNPPAASWEDVLKIEKPLGNVDRSLRLIRILREGGPEIVLVSFQAHPDCIGGEYISADFPAAVCRRVEEAVPGCHGVFLQGAQGNMVITDRTQPLPPYGIKNYEHAMDHGRKIADSALELYDHVPSVMQGGLACAQRFVRGKTKRGKLPLDYCQDIVSRYKAGGLAAIDPNPKIATPIVAEAQQVLGLERDGLDYIDIPVTVVTFCGLALAGIPGEPFSEIGRTIREASSFPVTCTCCLTNGTFGYFPDTIALEEGGYDTVNGKFLPGVSEELAKTAVELLAQLAE